MGVVASQVALVVKGPHAKAGDKRHRFNPLEKGMAIYSSILAWRIPWTEEPGKLHSPRGHKEWDMIEVT